MKTYFFALRDERNCITPCDLHTLNQWLYNEYDLTPIIHDHKTLTKTMTEHDASDDAPLSFVTLKWWLGLQDLITPYDYARMLYPFVIRTESVQDL